MRRDAVSGTLIILGCLLELLVMGLHPTGHDPVNVDTFSRFARMNVLVHSGALIAVPILFLGLLGLSRRLGLSDFTIAALVVHAFGSFAVLVAAVASGYVATSVIGELFKVEAGARPIYHALMEYTHMWNQAFARVFVVASAASILLWSTAIVTGRRLAIWLGIFGGVIGVAILVPALSGHLHLDTHGFGIVVLLQSLWLILVGITMFRGEAAPASRGTPQPEG